MKLYYRFIVALFLSFCFSFSISALEAGISFNTAAELSVWNEVITVQRAAGQDGYLKFYLNQGEGVAVSLKANITSGSQYIQFYQPDNIKAYFMGTTRSHGAVVVTSFTAAVTGSYWIKLSGAEGTSDIGVYQAFFNPDVADADRPFFSTFNTARYFAAGEYKLTDLPYFFRFEARAGDDITMSLTPKIASGSQRLDIFQPSNLFSSMVKSSALRNNNTGTVSFKAQTTGVYYASVSGANGHFVLSAQGVRADLDDDGDGLSNTAELVRGTRIDTADTNGNGINDLLSARLGLIGAFEKEFTRADLGEARSVPFALAIPYFDKPFSVDHDGDERFLAFSLLEGEGVTIELTAKINSGSQKFSLVQPDNLDRTFTSSNIAVLGSPAAISFTAAVTGTYYIRLTGAEGRSEIAVYKAFFNLDGLSGAQDYNKSFYTAKYLTSGKFPQNFETSVHRFVARVGDQISISLTPSVNVGSQRLRLYQPGVFDSNFLATKSLGNNSTGNLSFTAQADGVYFAEVIGDIGFYDLAVTGVRADVDTDGDGLTDSVEWFRGSRYDRVDTNGNGISDLEQAQRGAFGLYAAELSRSDIKNANSLLTAMPVPYFDKPFAVRFDGNNRFFSMTLNAGEGITLALKTKTNAGSMSLHVYQPYDLRNPIDNVAYTPRDVTGTTSVIANISGTYYFRLSGAVGIAELAVYRSFFNAGVSDDDRQFYSSMYTSRYLIPRLYNLAELDSYHRFEAKAGDEVTLSLTGGASSGGQSMQIWGPDSANSFRISASVLQKQVVTESFVAQITGVYYVKVTGGRGTYRLDASGIRPDADDDNDGFSNTAELARGTRVDLVDTNNNGLTDFEEALLGQFGIHPVQFSLADLSLASSISFAKPVPYKDKPFSIAFDGNDRYFAFDVTAGHSYTVTLTPRISNINSKQYLSIYAANNKTAPFLTLSGVSNGETLTASFTAELSGTFWFKLRGTAGSADLAVYNAFSNKGTVDSQRDFYGSFNTAQLLVSGVYTKQDNLNSYFRFDAVAGEEVSLSLSSSINLSSLRFAVFEPGQLDATLFTSNPVYNNQIVNRTFTATKTGTYFVRVSGVGGRFNLQVSGITPVIAGTVGISSAESVSGDDFIFSIRLASPLKEGQFVALSFNDQMSNEFLHMNCSGTVCILNKRLNLPNSSFFRAGVYDIDGRLIGNLTSLTQCLLPECVISLNVVGSGVVRLVDSVTPILGKPLRIVVEPNRGFQVSRAVSGSCEKGIWVSSTIYEITEFDQVCSAIFNFTKVKARRGFPMWLLTLEQ